jgi:hypothetical protein
MKQSRAYRLVEIASGGFDTADEHRLLNHPRNDMCKLHPKHTKIIFFHWRIQYYR